MGAGILQDLVVVMVIAAAVTILFYRLRQPVVLGYLLAGVLVGPHTTGLIHDLASIDGLAHLGLIFLMFAVGLEFDLKKLRKVGLKAALAASFQVALMMWLGFEAGRILGWTMMDSVFLGAIISISSTTIIVKVLAEMGKMKEEYSELAFGILIIEDILAIVIVAVFTTMGATGSFEASVVSSTIGAVLLFVFIFIAVCLVVVPRLIDVVSKFHVEEVLVITVVGLAFAAALLAENLGFSIALGAFLMGAIIAESRAVKRVEHKIVPIRDLFSSMFFVAVGAIINPQDLVTYWWPILLITVVTVVGKLIGVTVGSFLVGYDGKTSVKTGSAMAQIGEFSFIIAGLGLALGVIRPELHPIAVAVCAITSLTTPLLMRAGPALAERATPRLPGWYTSLLERYTRFSRRALSPAPDPLARGDARRTRHGTRMAIYGAWLFGLLIVAAYLSRWLKAEVSDALSLGDNATRAAGILFLGLCVLPLVVAFVKATEGYAFAAAKAREMRPRSLTHAEAFYRRPKFIARAVAGAASLVLVGLAVRVAWGVHPLAVPSLWLLVPVLMIIVFVGAFGWRRLERVYHGMEKTLNELLGHDDLAFEGDRNKQLRERLPWGMDMEEVTVRPIDRAAYMSLKALNLREATGATVLLVERGQQVIHNPHPDLPILPHDRIFLVGTRDQLANAARYLHSLAKPRDEPVVSREVRIPPSSPAVGRAIGALDLQHTTGAGVAMVQRADGELYAPSDRLEVQPDDHLVLYGPEGSIERARERLRATQRIEARPRIGPAHR